MIKWCIDAKKKREKKNLSHFSKSHIHKTFYIHQFIHFLGGQQSEKRSPDLLFPSHLSRLLPEGVPYWETSSLHQVLGVPQGLLPVVHVQNTSAGRQSCSLPEMQYKLFLQLYRDQMVKCLITYTLKALLNASMNWHKRSPNTWSALRWVGQILNTPTQPSLRVGWPGWKQHCSSWI